MDEQEGVSLVENLGCEGQEADEPYNEEDGGEIMVEVVGSDVFVDGVCGDFTELGQEGSGKGADMLDERRDFQSQDAEDSSGRAGQEDDGSTGDGVGGVIDVAGSSREVSEAAGIEIVPGVPSGTACVTGGEEDVEGNAVRSTEPAAHTDLTSLDVVSSSRNVSETVDTDAVPRLPSETTDRALEQVSTRDSEEEAEGNVVRSTLPIEGSTAPSDLASQGVGCSDDGLWKPGIEPLVGSSSFLKQGSLNLEVEEVSTQRLDFSQKDERSVREIVSQAVDKDVAGDTRDQISDHPAELAVSGDCGVTENTHSEVETMKSDLHDQETVGLGNKTENSHPNVEPMETDVYAQDDGLLNKDSFPVPVSGDAANSCADGTVSLKPSRHIHETKGGHIRVVTGDSGISVEHTQVSFDHSLSINGNNVPSHPGEQEHGMKENSVAENGAIGSSYEKADYAEVQEVKVDAMHEDDKSDPALSTEPEASLMETQIGNHKEVSVEDSEVSSSKIPISSDKDEIVRDSDKSVDMQPKEGYGVSDFAHDDSLMSSGQVSVHDAGNLDEMEIEQVGHKTTGTLTFPKNDESLNIMEVDSRLGNDVRIGPLETSHEPACRTDGASVEMDKEGDAQLGTTTTSLSCSVDKNILEVERRVSLETMLSTGVTNTGDETNRVTDYLPKGLDSDMSLQHVETETESLFLFDDYPGKEDDRKMSVVSSNDDAMTDVPEGTSLACQFTSKTSDSNAVNKEPATLLKDNNLKVESEHKVEAEDPALGEGSAQGRDLTHNTKNCVIGMHSNIAEESGSSVTQEGVVENAHILAVEMGHDSRNAATVDKMSNEENNSNVEGAINSQTAISSGAYVPPAGDQIIETCIFHISTAKISQADGDQESLKANESLVFNVHAPEMRVTDEQEKGEVEKRHPDTVQESSEHDKRTGEIASNHSLILNEKPVSMFKMHPGYLSQPENEGVYSVSDLVWGKVRSHPWWPGQIFDPSDASAKASKYHKKDSFLVAYFGDRTFAWNDASVLRPFRSHFSHIQKQSNSETFQNAISCALEEVSRRVELGLACSCIPEDSYNKISCQVVENTGISEESSKRYGVDKSTGVTSFVPEKLVHYMKALALSPTCQADRLDLSIARAQLVAFCRFKGYRLPPGYLLSGELLENEAEITRVDSAIDDKRHALEAGEQYPTSKVVAHKCKKCSKVIPPPKKKERSLSELMDDIMGREYSSDGEDDSDEKTFTSSKKRKVANSLTGGLDKRRSVYTAKVSTTVSASPKPSFRIGECIQRVASQLTRSAPQVKCNSDQAEPEVQLQNCPKGEEVIPTELPSPKELLSQLKLAAWAPLKGYNFLKTITSFFSGFRKSVAASQHTRRQKSSAARPRKKRASQNAAGFAEEYEFDDVNDSYWTDRVVQNYGEEQQQENNQCVEGENHLTVQDPEKSNKPGRRPYNRKRKSSADDEMTPGVPPEDIEKRKHEPAELIIKFAEGGPLPSEMNLNKMFRRFGPLKELETEVHQESSRARVVFKRGSDAEVAHSSIGTFSIFGSRQVTYELSYTPVISFKPTLLTVTPDLEGAI